MQDCGLTLKSYCSKRILVPCTLFRLIPYSGVLNSRTYRNKWTPGKICRKTINRTPVLHYPLQQIKEHPAPFCHCANNQTRLTIRDTGVCCSSINFERILKCVILLCCTGLFCQCPPGLQKATDLADLSSGPDLWPPLTHYFTSKFSNQYW